MTIDDKYATTAAWRGRLCRFYPVAVLCFALKTLWTLIPVFLRYEKADYLGLAIVGGACATSLGVWLYGGVAGRNESALTLGVFHSGHLLALMYVRTLRLLHPCQC